jgi:membrane protease YdiL (CAAX protease family)
MPAITLASHVLMRAAGAALPPADIRLAPSLLLFLGLAVAGFFEEAGWSGYATDALQERRGPLAAALVIGLVWAVWHIVPLVQAHRQAGWIAWWGLGTVGSRVIIVWLYNHSGRSVVAAALYHAMSNLCWQLFPQRGSHYDPRYTSPLILAVAAVVTLTCARSRRDYAPL